MKKLLFFIHLIIPTSIFAQTDTLSMGAHVQIHFNMSDIPVMGLVSDLLINHYPDSLKSEYNECGSIFDEGLDNSYALLHRFYIEGIEFQSQGIDYEFYGMEMKDKSLSFSRKGRSILFSENTTESEFVKIFPNSEVYKSDSNETIYNVYIENDNPESYWVFTFDNNKLKSIHVFRLTC